MSRRKWIALLIIFFVGVVFFGFREIRYQQPPSLPPPSQPYVELSVDSYVKDGEWMRGTDTDLPIYVSTIVYVICNNGTAAAYDVQITVSVDGEIYKRRSLTELASHESSTNQFSISINYDTSHQVSIMASSQVSSDTATLTIRAVLPRVFSSETAKLFVTPNDPIVKGTLNKMFKAYHLVPKHLLWIAIRDWVAKNVEYKHDSSVYGGEHWQLPRETLQRGTGDCEDFSLLLCSLFRAAGYSADEVYIVLGEKDGDYHGWVRIYLGDIVGWQSIEPQEGALNTLIGDFLSLSGYTAKYEFNDLHLKH